MDQRAAGSGAWQQAKRAGQDAWMHVLLALASEQPQPCWSFSGMTTDAWPSGLQDIHDFYYGMDLNVSEAE